MNPTILLVEDNEDDVFLMRRALKNGGVENPLQVVVNGQQAVDYLAGAKQYADREQFPLPFLVFLDLKLPFLDGFEVLTWMRRQPQLDQVIVIVLTSSAELRDKDRAYALGARSYLTKPPKPEENSRTGALTGKFLAGKRRVFSDSIGCVRASNRSAC